MVVHATHSPLEKEAFASMEAGFSGKLEKATTDHEAQIKESACKDQTAKRETGFFRTRLQPFGFRRRKEMIEPSNDNPSITAQCRLLSISRSGFYITLQKAKAS
jgi:uncharacterized protein YdaT